MKTFLDTSKLTVIAEIGVNHEGNVEHAEKMLILAANAGADYVKFQSYTPSRYSCANDSKRFRRVEKFSLKESDFIYLKRVAEQNNIGFLSTPLTEDWVPKLNPLCPAFKIASGDITFKPVIKAAVGTGKPIILSTGAASIDEVEQAVEWIREEIGNRPLQEHLILMHCIATYPAPFEQANLLSIPFLKKHFGVPVGYSNHVIGINACLVAVSLGAQLVEVHFTDKKTGRDFHDHELSFEPDDLKSFIQEAKKIKSALGVMGKFSQPCEQDNLKLIRKGIIAASDLKAGTIISEDLLAFARPATEFDSSEIHQIIGHRLREDIQKGYLIKRCAVECVE